MSWFRTSYRRHLHLQLNFEPHLGGTLVSNPAVLEATHKCLCLEPNAARRLSLSLTLHWLDPVVVEQFKVTGILNVGRVMKFQHNTLSPFRQGIIGLWIKTRLFGRRAFLVKQQECVCWMGRLSYQSL